MILKYYFRLSILTLLILFVSRVSAQQTQHSFDNAPLRTVINFLEDNYGLVFSYRDLNIKDAFISIEKIKDKNLDQLLSEVFVQTDLRYSKIDETHFLISIDPDKKDEIFKICGYLKDELSGEALSLASVFEKGSSLGSSSDDSGYFEFNSTNRYGRIVISYIGYNNLEIPVFEFSDSVCHEYLLSPNSQMLESIIVKEYLVDGIDQSVEGTKIKISPDELSLLAGSVEPDILNSIQMLPGIYSADETASGLNIRGGTPDQNLILYDGIPVFHAGHFFGMISAFNPYIVEEVDVYRSGISTEFGGRASGVIDIKSFDKAPEKFSLGAGLNLTHGHINLRTPLWKNAGLDLSLRRSFTDFWATPTFIRMAEKVFQGTKIEDGILNPDDFFIQDKYYFSDFNAKWIWTPGKNEFGLSLLAGLNDLNYATEIPAWNAFSLDNLNLENGGANFYWNRQWADNYRTRFKITNSTYDYNYDLSLNSLVLQDQQIAFFGSKNYLSETGISFINEWQFDESQNIQFGIQYNDTEIDLSIASQQDSTLFNFENKLTSLFGEYELNVFDKLHVSMGLRYQILAKYDRDYFEPRVSLSSQINEKIKLKLSSSKQFQFVSQLVLLDVNNIGVANQVWIASDINSIPVIESNQWSGGIMYYYNGWTIDLEGYVKELTGITSLSSSFSSNPQQGFSAGNARIRGIDLLVKKRFGRFRTWLSYTLSSAIFEFPEITAVTFPASHDQRHQFQLMNIMTHGPWEFSVGWQFRSGLPFSEPVGIETTTNQNGQEISRLNYLEQNGERLNAYHRLDASLMYRFGNKNGFNGFAGLSLFNIYNTDNLLGRQYIIENLIGPDEKEILEISEFGLKFTPNLVLRIQL